MDNLKELMKKVTSSDIVHMDSWSSSGVNLKSMKKELEEKKNEKIKVYGFIGMETYDLIKGGKVEIHQLEGYMEKMDELNRVVAEMEDIIKTEEAKIKGKNICSCGYKLKSQDRFCPNCGEVVVRDTIICNCGAEIKRDSKFCHICGKSIEELIRREAEEEKSPDRECICGAKVPKGQFMCLECGRKIE